MKENKKEKLDIRPFILPVVTIVFFIVLFSVSPKIASSFFSETRNSWNSLSGLAIGETKYILQGFIEVSVEEGESIENCTTKLSVFSGDKQFYEYSMVLEDFLEKSDKKDKEYSFSLETLGIMLNKGEYDVGFEVLCNGVSISKSSQKISI